MERIFATYLIETPLAVEKAAAVLAGEQSSGTFVAVPGETAELKQRFAARVEKITPLETVSEPSLPGAAARAENFSARKLSCRGRWKISGSICRRSFRRFREIFTSCRSSPD